MKPAGSAGGARDAQQGLLGLVEAPIRRRQGLLGKCRDVQQGLLGARRTEDRNEIEKLRIGMTQCQHVLTGHIQVISFAGQRK